LRPTPGIVHCDVTLRNILLDERGWPYLADFDLSQIVEVAQAANPIGPVTFPLLSLLSFPKYPACIIILTYLLNM
jgi:serine/threonine protein kinase